MKMEYSDFVLKKRLEWEDNHQTDFVSVKEDWQKELIKQWKREEAKTIFNQLNILLNQIGDSDLKEELINKLKERDNVEA